MPASKLAPASSSLTSNSIRVSPPPTTMRASGSEQRRHTSRHLLERWLAVPRYGVLLCNHMKIKHFLAYAVLDNVASSAIISVARHHSNKSMRSAIRWRLNRRLCGKSNAINISTAATPPLISYALVEPATGEGCRRHLQAACCAAVERRRR